MVAAFCAATPMEAKKKKRSRKPARTTARAPKPKPAAAPLVSDIPVIPETKLSPKHEMRGAWLATVYGIDWPSKQGSTAAIADVQRRELAEILDILQSAGINAVLLQVRPMADAFYRSSLEPWSRYLTGERGGAPATGWDPLAFAVEEAHLRGMELHAWVNPFRLSSGEVPAATRAANGKCIFDPVKKGWVITWRKPARKGEKASTVSILDPGNPEARKHIVDVCREIVTQYDVDGLVFDDYFYPDRLPLGSGFDFNDYKRDIKHMPEGMEAPSQAEWRRGNVARTIADVHAMLAEERPWVRFGVAPAGVAGGNGESASRYGLRVPVGNDWMYDRIFCDPLRWLSDGTVDYVSPQLYWPSGHATNPYAPLAEWWGDVAVRFGRHCYPSQSVGTLPQCEAALAEQGFQVGTNRRCSTGADAGSVFYSTMHLTGKKMKGMADYLASECYRNPALLPAMTWKDAPNPGTIESVERKGDILEWKTIPQMRYVVYAVPDEVDLLDALASEGRNFAPEYILGVTYSGMFELPKDKLKDYWYSVAPYDRYGNEWDAAVLSNK